MSSDSPVILEAAINGVTTRDRNPSVPRTPKEIAAESIACIEAGASIIHNHNDDPVIDMVTRAHDAQPYIDAWRPVLERYPDARIVFTHRDPVKSMTPQTGFRPPRSGMDRFLFG